MDKKITTDMKNKKNVEKFENEIYGESYYFIPGYTSGGAPYGISMEEAKELGMLEEENDSVEKDLDYPF